MSGISMAGGWFGSNCLFALTGQREMDATAIPSSSALLMTARATLTRLRSDSIGVPYVATPAIITCRAGFPDLNSITGPRLPTSDGTSRRYGVK